MVDKNELLLQPDRDSNVFFDFQAIPQIFLIFYVFCKWSHKVVNFHRVRIFSSSIRLMGSFSLPGVDFTRVLWEAFFACRSKKTQMTVDLTIFFVLLGSVLLTAVSKHVCEIEPRCQFHQHSMSSFYAHRSRKYKKDWQLYFFALLGSALVKSYA